MEKLTLREKELISRNTSGYYRCKVRHAQLYEDMATAYAYYISLTMLEQLQHSWDTQKNEGLNTSVASYAPKHKHYSSTTSLDTRVAIAGAVQVLGYEGFWERCFDVLGLDIDDEVRNSWMERDTIKHNKTARESSIEGKSRRGKRKYKKLYDHQKAALESYKEGLGYESGLALSAAAKVLKSSPKFKARNPPGTPKKFDM